MKDEEIIELCWKRDETAIAAMAKQYDSYCRTISFHILQSNEDAEECVNDTWLQAWNSIPPQQPGCLAAYLGKITRNLSLDRFKRRHAQKRGCGQTELVLSELEDCISAESDVEASIDEIVLAQSISAFLRAQPERKRNVFIRRYWYLYPIKDIANIYGMSESKTASLLLRMRNQLKLYLKKEGITL